MAAPKKQMLLIAKNESGENLKIKASVRQAEIKKAFLEGAGYEVHLFDLEADPRAIKDAAAPAEEQEIKIPPVRAAAFSMAGMLTVLGLFLFAFYLEAQVSLRVFQEGLGWLLGFWFLEVLAVVFIISVIHYSLEASTHHSKGGPKARSADHHNRLGGQGAGGYATRKVAWGGIRRRRR